MGEYGSVVENSDYIQKNPQTPLLAGRLEHF
jgi:hypothetical protein